MGFLDAVDKRILDRWLKAQAITGNHWMRFFIKQDVISEVQESGGLRCYVKGTLAKNSTKPYATPAMLRLRAFPGSLINVEFF